MSDANSIFTKIDAYAERRRALAKVYSLLIRLAEEAETHTTLTDIVSEDEIKKEAGVYLQAEFSISDAA